MKDFMKKLGFLFLICLFISCTSKPYVIKIGKEKVFLPEFNVYLLSAQDWYWEILDGDIDEDWQISINGKSVGELAKEKALNTIMQVKISNHFAENLGIVLTKDEKQQATKEAEVLFQKTPQNRTPISLHEMEKIMLDKAIFLKVYNHLTDRFTFSQLDFDSYYQEHKNEYQSLDIYWVKFFTATKAQEFFEKLKQNSMTTLAKKLHSQEGEDLGRFVYTAGHLDKEFDQKIFEMEIGDKAVIPYHNEFYVVKIYGSDYQEMELKEKLMDIYMDENKNILFQESYEKWKNEISIDFNENYYHEISIIY